jgi:hypothetical protein
MRCLVVVPIALAFAAVGCGEPASPAGPTPAGAGSVSELAAVPAGSRGTLHSNPAVPFQGSVQGEADPPVFEPPPSTYFSAHLAAQGEATHLGRFTMDFSHRVNLVTLVGVGKATFTAANGDTLLTDVEGVATPAGTPTSFTVVETHEVTGGTGRFAHASGTLTVTRAVDFANPSTSGRIEGWITAPGLRF